MEDLPEIHFCVEIGPKHCGSYCEFVILRKLSLILGGSAAGFYFSLEYWHFPTPEALLKFSSQLGF